jgi:hypothetical protein
MSYKILNFKKETHRVVNSLWTSKLRYELQLWTEVSRTEDQPKSLLVTIAQNNLLRLLDETRIVDHKSNKKC